LMWISSLVVSLGIVYGAGKFITNLTQTAIKGDVITSDWVNAVNTKMSSSGEYVKGSFYGYCSHNQERFSPHEDSAQRTHYYCVDSNNEPYASISPAYCKRLNLPYSADGNCACLAGFKLISIGERGYTCMKQ
ncbi:MAG: hypothetical protein V3575_01275, partial [Candidatus Absconditabacteria bacterium]